eukprot:GHRQ01037313.1.p1 GENE.GHRQ01037313.1~~GHRQ01037313.1.p1  ORF type:complete len:125 (-),score=29.41 GHRQ01037313.1:116-490(-)
MITCVLHWLLLCSCYITPKLYLDLLQQYSTMLSNGKAELGGNRRRLLDGIAKLAETNTALDAMQTQLNGLQPLLLEKTASTSALYKQVGCCWPSTCICPPACVHGLMRDCLQACLWLCEQVCMR